MIAIGRAGVFSYEEDLISPAVSPDGKRMAFASERGIETVPLDGGARKLLVPVKIRALDAPDAKVAWSPDGARLAYLFRGALWVANEDGSSPHRVSQLHESVHDFA